MIVVRLKMNQNRVIGRVLAVDNYRVFIKIEDELKGSYKNGITDIYEIARINSYLIIPVGADRIVALITRVTMKEEVSMEQGMTSIMLPSSARYISATMLGTIVQSEDHESYIQGVYSFPALDNPVWYVTKKDLDQIFDNKTKNTIDYEKDFYLPIGTSPAFQGYRVKICPDQLFVKHVAILGNTGSGKSCTLTSILRNLFKFNYKDNKKLSNAHIVIFDTNGEYKEAFCPDWVSQESAEDPEIRDINAYYYGGEDKVKVPYWLMNWHDFKSFLQPGDGVQAPILNRAIGLAKNEFIINQNKKYSIVLINTLQSIINTIKSPDEQWKLANFSDAISDIKNKDYCFGDLSLSGVLDSINIEKNTYKKLSPSLVENVITNLERIIFLMCEENAKCEILSENNIDLPIWFNYKELCSVFLNHAIAQEESTNNRINEYVSTLRLRMNSFLNDKRMAIPLMLKDEDEINKNVLPQFLSLILGDYDKCFSETDKKNFVKNYNSEYSKKHSLKTHQISIIDMSMLPYEVLDTITGLLGRIILEFVSLFLPEKRGKYPIVLILEEAQNYISEGTESIAKTVFERIAREGRKYGISLIVSSQRPSELSKTVLSQCNSFIIHRLQNPDDQKYVRGLISSANADLLDQLPIIPQQHAIITGDCVRTPIQVRIDDVYPTPNSHNPRFVENWLKDDAIPYVEICERWING